MNKGLFTVSTGLALVLSASAWSTAYAQQQGQQLQVEPQRQQQTQGQAVEVVRPGEEQQAGQQQGQQRIDLVTWRDAYDVVREGWTAEWMFDQPVYGVEGDDIGEIEDIFISGDGRIDAVIVEAGGFLDIGDVHLRVPWEEVEIGQDGRIVIDVREENVPDFDLATPDPETGPRTFRANELIGDYVSLEDEQTYGYVTDVAFDTDGEITAVIVSPSYGYGARTGRPGGYYAYPFYGYGAGYGFAPGRGYYDMPYTAGETAELEPFDYRGMQFGGADEEEGALATGGQGQLQ